MVQKKNLFLKIGVPLLIVGIIGFIFASKIEENGEQESNLSSNILSYEVDSIDIENLKTYNLPILIDFGADGCLACQQIEPILKKLYEKWQGKVIIQSVDVWKNKNAAADFPIQLIPTLVLYTKEGTPYVPSKDLEEELGLTLYYHKDTGEHLFTIYEGVLSEEDLEKIFIEMGA